MAKIEVFGEAGSGGAGSGKWEVGSGKFEAGSGKHEVGRINLPGFLQTC